MKFSVSSFGLPVRTALSRAIRSFAAPSFALLMGLPNGMIGCKTACGELQADSCDYCSNATVKAQCEALVRAGDEDSCIAFHDTGKRACDVDAGNPQVGVTACSDLNTACSRCSGSAFEACSDVVSAGDAQACANYAQTAENCEPPPVREHNDCDTLDCSICDWQYSWEYDQCAAAKSDHISSVCSEYLTSCPRF